VLWNRIRKKSFRIRAALIKLAVSHQKFGSGSLKNHYGSTTLPTPASPRPAGWNVLYLCWLWGGPTLYPLVAEFLIAVWLSVWYAGALCRHLPSFNPGGVSTTPAPPLGLSPPPGSGGVTRQLLGLAADGLYRGGWRGGGGALLLLVHEESRHKLRLPLLLTFQ